MLRAVAEVTAVGFLADQLDELVAAERVRQSPGCSLIAPHQGGVNDETTVHPERQCRLQRLQGVVSAIGVAGIVGFAHLADKVPRRAAVTESGGEGKEQQIAAGDKSVRQAALLEGDRDVAGQRRIADLPEYAQINEVVLAELAAPIGKFTAQPLDKAGAAVELDAMALAVS